LVYGSPLELIRSRGIVGLVDQLAEWIERAAMVRLIDPRHGWEPTRRDGVDDLVILDSAWVRGLQEREEGCKSFEATYRFSQSGSTARIYRVTLRDTAATLKDDLVRGWKFSEQEGTRSGKSLGLVAWSGKAPDGQPFVASRYMPETVTDVASLLARAGELGCGEQLTARLGLLSQRLAGRSFRVPVPLIVVILVRRPSNLVGTTSPVEMLPYLIELNGSDELSAGSTIPVRIASQRDQISGALLRRASDDDTDTARQPWTLLGCGSVGSKIAVHMARAGRGPSLLIDRGIMSPHNMARHALLPAYPGATVSSPKSELLANALETLAQSALEKQLDIVAALVAPEPDAAPLLPPGDMMIVNATGSISVREALSLDLVVDSRPRVIEACLLGAGKIGFVSVEGAKSNPTTADLAVEAYRLLGDDPKVADVVFGENAEARSLSVGQGCASITFPMSDALLSTMAAPMATVLSRYQRDGLPNVGGELVLGKLADDGLGVSWERLPCAPFVHVARQGKVPAVRISGRVDGMIRSEVASKPGSETGGVIVGRFSEATETFHVVDLVEAPPDSRFTREEFVLGTEGLKKRINDLIKKTNGALHPLGTWHNHLITSGPSRKDVMTALGLAAAQTFPLLMLIHTPGGYRTLIAEVLSSATPRCPEKGDWSA